MRRSTLWPDPSSSPAIVIPRRFRKASASRVVLAVRARQRRTGGKRNLLSPEA